jgi:hypothetical protein
MVQKVSRMLNNNTKRGYVLLVTCSIALLSTGCRSMPGRNLFSFRNGPSPEALAGEGPTVTYPSPPSESATPEAIASIAGGTAVPTTSPTTSPPSATAQVSGVDVLPGYATPASTAFADGTSQVNMAAAQANGIYGGSSLSNYQPPKPNSPATSGASGYTFGSKALTPKTEIAPVADTTPAMPSWTKTAPPSNSNPTPGGFAPPPASNLAVPAAGPKSGFTMPTDSPAVAAITLPSQPTVESSPEPSETATPFAPPPASSPDFSTASTGAITAPSTTTPGLPSVTNGASSYTPGSTGAASGYPVGDSAAPNTKGSFFR